MNFHDSQLVRLRHSLRWATQHFASTLAGTSARGKAERNELRSTEFALISELLQATGSKRVHLPGQARVVASARNSISHGPSHPDCKASAGGAGRSIGAA